MKKEVDRKLAQFPADQLHGMGSAFFDVPRGITHHLKRRFSHEQMDSERRQGIFFSLLDHRFVPGEVFRSGILDFDVTESGLLQQCHRLGRRNQVGAAAVC